MFPERNLTNEEKEALQHLSWSYGAGDYVIAFAQDSYLGCIGIAIFRLQYGFNAVKFHISDGKMHAFGRRKKIETD